MSDPRPPTAPESTAGSAARSAHSLDALLTRLADRLGPTAVVTDPAALAPFLDEQRGRFRSRAGAVIRPSSTGEVAAAVRLAAEARVPIVPQGGNTGLVGGAVAEVDRPALILNLGRMNRILDLDPLNDTITVEAGCVLADIRARAEAADRLFPLSLGAEGSCQIGGNLSTNAGGTNVLRYGNARELALGLEVVLADGQIWDGRRGLRKDNSGYDMKQVFIGAEGTLGIITGAVLKLLPRPKDRATAFAALASVEAAMALFAAVRQTAGDALTGFEYVSGTALAMVLAHIGRTRPPLPDAHRHWALIELASPDGEARLADRLQRALAGGLEAGTVLDAALAQNDGQARAFWRLRETIPEAQRFEGGSIKHDISVPISAVATFIARAEAAATAAVPGVRPCVFGHLGDGNIHFNLSQPRGANSEEFLNRWDEINVLVEDIAAELGGSFSAEHGVGLAKRAALRRFKSPVERDLMARLKAALDPDGLLNPGKILG